MSTRHSRGTYQIISLRNAMARALAMFLAPSAVRMHCMWYGAVEVLMPAFLAEVSTVQPSAKYRSMTRCCSLRTIRFGWMQVATSLLCQDSLLLQLHHSILASGSVSVIACPS